jgi:hypothetical protein
MTRIQGQILRTGGLFIEMLGILALMFRNRNDGVGMPLLGSFSEPRAWAVIGAGFVIWLLGNVVIYWPRPVRKQVPRAEDAADQGKLRL